MNKYKLTDITKEWNGRTLYRIQAIRDFGLVKAGDLGGWVEHEINLSHDGGCWIFNDAIVCDLARIKNNAYIYQSAIAKDEARVEDWGQVYNNAIVCDNAVLCGNAKINNNVKLFDRAMMTDDSSAWENAEIGGVVTIGSKAKIMHEGFITSHRDIFWAGPFGHDGHTLTAFRCKDGRVYVYFPFGGGYINEFDDYVISAMNKSSDKKLYKLMIQFIKTNFEL